MERSHPPPARSRIDQLIGDALDEATQLSWHHAACPASGNGHALQLAAPDADAFPGYQIIKQIRSGGQGVVYIAVDDATEQRVAIKAFRPTSIASPRDRYRFEREVEALQGICHPAIVRILRADAAAERPYIVMDHIRGWNLDEYFREHCLDVRATMRLFGRIVAGVHAAHQKGVIHRDIKPSNIRVDDDGEPHIFDFGLAKLDAAPEATMTETGQFLGTLHWVSPEQAEGRLRDVDVRTDVYSLGMVLYHMLTGELPFERGGSMRDVLNRIVATEPVPPRKWRREIDDDVETIVLKCLAKEPSRRYASAAALGEDVERWLEGRPILAKRDSLGYVVGKFVRRHLAGVAACTAIAILILAATVVSGVCWQRAEREAEQARRERDRTEVVADFLSETLRSPEEATDAGERMVLKRMMDRATEQLGARRVLDVPEVELRLRLITGNAYFFIGEYGRAAELFASGEELARTIHGPDHSEVARAMSLVGEALGMVYRPEESLLKHRGALEILRRQDDAPDALLAEVLTKLGLCLIGLGRPEEALPYANEALELCRNARLGAQSTARALTLVGHASAEMDRGAEALAAYSELLAMCQRTPIGRNSGADLLAQTEGNVGKALMALDRHEEALVLLEQGLERWRETYADDHPYLVTARRLAACCLQALGGHAGAVSLFEQALGACRSLNPGPHSSTAEYCSSLANGLLIDGRPAEAEEYARHAAAMARAHPEWGAPVRVVAEWALARALAASGRGDEAVAASRDYAGNLEPPDRIDAQMSLVLIADAIARRMILAEAHLLRSGPGDAETGEALARECVALWDVATCRGKFPPWLGFHVKGLLGAALAAQHEFREAQPLLLEARSGFTNAMRTTAQRHTGIDLQREAEERLAWFYERWHAAEPGAGYDAEAAKWRRVSAGSAPMRP